MTLVQKGDVGREFLDAILSACDVSNWDADLNTGDRFRGLNDAYALIHEIALDFQMKIYEAASQRAALVHALEMVRDANRDDPHIPPIALATIDAALAASQTGGGQS